MEFVWKTFSKRMAASSGWVEALVGQALEIVSTDDPVGGRTVLAKVGGRGRRFDCGARVGEIGAGVADRADDA